MNRENGRQRLPTAALAMGETPIRANVPLREQKMGAGLARREQTRAVCSRPGPAALPKLETYLHVIAFESQAEARAPGAFYAMR